jgi:hypothetical protein
VGSTGGSSPGKTGRSGREKSACGPCLMIWTMCAARSTSGRQDWEMTSERPDWIAIIAVWGEIHWFCANVIASWETFWRGLVGERVGIDPDVCLTEEVRSEEAGDQVGVVHVPSIFRSRFSV